MTARRHTTVIASAAAFGLMLTPTLAPASAQIVSGSGSLVGEGQAALPGVGAAGQGSVNGTIGVDADALLDRTRSTVRGTIDTTQRAAKRTKDRVGKTVKDNQPSVSADASASASASSEGARAEGSTNVSVNRPD